MNKYWGIQMRKLVLTAVLVSLFNAISFGQLIGGEFEKLGTLYLEGKYEACGMKALKYTESDKTKKHPEPYLYLAMSFFQLSESTDEKIIEYYTGSNDALKTAMKWAAKFKKKDKEDDYYSKNAPFITKLKMKALNVADIFFEEGNYRKAQYYYKSIVKFDDDPNVKFMWGICDIKLKSVSQAALSIHSATKDLHKTYNEGDYDPEGPTSYELSKAMIEYCHYLVEQKDLDSAKVTINMARKLLPGNIEIQEEFGNLID